jgi:poly(3-hydroxybutyrate) depolymerase
MSNSLEATVDFVYDMAYEAVRDPVVPFLGGIVGSLVGHLLEDKVSSTSTRNQHANNITQLQYKNSQLKVLYNQAGEAGNNSVQIFLEHQEDHNAQKIINIRASEPHPPSTAENVAFIASGGLIGALGLTALSTALALRNTLRPYRT